MLYTRWEIYKIIMGIKKLAKNEKRHQQTFYKHLNLALLITQNNKRRSEQRITQSYKTCSLSQKNTKSSTNRKKYFLIK